MNLNYNPSQFMSMHTPDVNSMPFFPEVQTAQLESGGPSLSLLALVLVFVCIILFYTKTRKPAQTIAYLKGQVLKVTADSLGNIVFVQVYPNRLDPDKFVTVPEKDQNFSLLVPKKFIEDHNLTNLVKSNSSFLFIEGEVNPSVLTARCANVFDQFANQTSIVFASEPGLGLVKLKELVKGDEDFIKLLGRSSDDSLSVLVNNSDFAGA